MKLNISKLLEKDDEIKSKAGRKHSIVLDGIIDVFNLKVFAFLICRGQHKRKIDIMYDLIWQKKNAKKKWPRITWTHKNLKPFFKKLFFFTEVYPKKLFKVFEEDLSVHAFREQRGIKSLERDDSWSAEYLEKMD